MDNVQQVKAGSKVECVHLQAFVSFRAEEAVIVKLEAHSATSTLRSVGATAGVRLHYLNLEKRQNKNTRTHTINDQLPHREYNPMK